MKNNIYIIKIIIFIKNLLKKNLTNYKKYVILTI